MKLVVDGVFYQFARTGIARVWSSLLPRLARYPGLEIILLDRGNCPKIAGVEIVEFPSYTMGAYTAADSLKLDGFCREAGADVFTSTYYTTPVKVPSVMMVYDMIPEVLGFDLKQRAWQEKSIAISFASHYACISGNTRSDLLRFYPHVALDRATVTYCGIERDVFRPCGFGEVEAFKRAFGVTRPYYVLVGSRKQHQGYKNTSLLFDALHKVNDLEIEILCIGGEPEIDAESLAKLPRNIAAHRVELSDAELACAYSGAQALVFPSLYEGFGMPVVEAMACGCPVITTKLGSLGEVAGSAAVLVSGHDTDELLDAMAFVRKPDKREQLIADGKERATLYDWDIMARGFYDLLEKAAAQGTAPATQAFFRDWEQLRKIQADVDAAR